ncbi:protein kinase domain-containing protein [Tundrisphaera sp. TA3]|uniref:protein kinase domain-containing protein n=1 Tax=Tundrisphaera sp. TA3 TaxID=3435775 RepID=UPI003EC1538B
MQTFFHGRGGPSQGDRLIDLFEERWATEEPSVEEFWGRRGADCPITVLSELIKVDIRNRFDRGEIVPASSYLERFPELIDHKDRVVSLVYEEYCLREENGEILDASAFCENYARWRDSLYSQIGFHRQLSQTANQPRKITQFPKAGERFSRYTLRRVLGTGGSARVYLATENDLDDRQVVLKISEADGREASILSHLRHPNIVSVLSRIETNESGLRGFSMFYSPGITLDKTIGAIREQGRPKTARDFWKLLDAPEPKPPRAGGSPTGWDDFPIDGTFHQAIAWIGLCLANALIHAHEEEILHRDVKPANILLTYEEGPKLFDFNLADEPWAPAEAAAAQRGGTLPYMSPEQLHAFVDPRGWDAVGRPADVYSLGLVLREILTGVMPEMPKPGLPLTRSIQDLWDRRSTPMEPVRKIDPGIPPALDSILSRSLEPDVSRRYASAAEFAEDLRLFLDRRPLKHAPNTSRMELSANFAWRNRRHVRVAGSIVLAIALMIAWAMVCQSLDERKFRAAIVAMDANRLKEAREVFSAYHRAHPSSARAKLYLGLTLERQGGNVNDDEARRLYSELRRTAGAEAEIRERLKVEPNSSFLLTQLGLIYQDEGREPEAHEVLTAACKTKEPLVQAFFALSDVELKLGHLQESVEILGRGIGLVRTQKIDPSIQMILAAYQSYALRVLDLLAEVDRSEISEETSARLARLYDRIEEIIPLIDVPWSASMRTRMKAPKDFWIYYFRGLVASGRARLALVGGEPAEMNRQIKIAMGEFFEAERRHPDPRPRQQRLHLQMLQSSSSKTIL